VPVIDEEGNLFGVVNVVDALVVLFVLAVVVAGIALVAGPLANDGDGTGLDGNDDDGGTPTETRDPATRYATIDLGGQPAYVAERIAEGDRMSSPDTPGNLTVTDVYVGPGSNATATATVVVRARLEGELVDNRTLDRTTFEFVGGPVTRGRAMTIDAEEYTVEGTVQTVDEEGADLSTSSRRVLVRATVRQETAHTIEEGDVFRVADRTVGTVETLTVYPGSGPGERVVMVGLDLTAIDRPAGATFAGSRLRLGTRVPFETNDYALSGEVIRRNAVSLPGEPERTTVTVELRNVSPRRADSISVGMTEAYGDTTTAEVVAKDVEPATVVVRSDDGNVYEREHPRNVVVSLTLQLRTRRTNDGLQFRGRPLRSGEAITFDFGSVTVEGTIIEIEDG